MLGIGGLIAVPFTQRFGRLPVLWWSMFMSLFMTLFATLAPNNTAFIVARCLQGLFTTPPQCIGLSFIHDMYPPLMLPLMHPSCSPHSASLTILPPSSSPICLPHHVTISLYSHHPFPTLITNTPNFQPCYSHRLYC